MQTLAQDPNNGNAVKESPPKMADETDAAAATAAASSGGGFDTVTGLLGSPEGAALRRVAMDADSISLIRHLVRVWRRGMPADPSRTPVVCAS